jgi:hypothetical protein
LRFPRGTVNLPSVNPENKVERKRGEKKERKKKKNTHTAAS